MNHRFPFSSFPNGWFRVAFSDELPPGKVMPLRYFGKDLVLFRTEDGVPHVWDAHCPHLGAHLGYGGTVQGDTIQCFFHGWCFDKKGSCVDIPYATKKLLPSVKVHTWPVHEVHGLIMVYHHAQKEAPTWTIPSQLPDWNSREWTPFMRYHWKIRTHVQEMIENIADNGHFLSVHKDFVAEIKDSHIEIDGEVSMRRILFRYNLGLISKLGVSVESIVTSRNHGLGCTISYTLAKAMIDLHLLTVVLITPIDEEYVDAYMLSSVKKVFNPLATSLLAKKSHKDATTTITQDVPIWENKVYRSHPLLCDGDGPIMQYRHWARQFYPEITVENFSLQGSNLRLGSRE